MSKENFLTPPKEMFERNHNLIPEIDEDYYELELLSHGKDDANPIIMTLEDLKRMQPTHEVMAAIACAGSKRLAIKEKFPSVKGLGWTTGAVGNAVYKGVPVRNLILDSMGMKEEDLVGKGLHLIAISYDADF